VKILGGKSGFKTARDLILFSVGLGICVFHVVTTSPAELSVPLLLFGGGLAGAPSILNKDESKDKDNGAH
jgi:F0F1-type ATP synthase assembly protein I